MISLRIGLKEYKYCRHIIAVLLVSQVECGPLPAVSCYLDHTPPIKGINCSYHYTREDFPKLREAFNGRGIVQAMFDNGETAEEMIAGFREMMECFAPDVIAVPICSVDDAWNDDDITVLYWEMRKISEEYAANMKWRPNQGRKS